MSRTSLELAVQVTDSNGTTYQWGANQPASHRITGLRFSTKLGDGFSDGGGALARRIDIDAPDLELLNDVEVFGADGWKAYEGRIAAMPRELADTHSIGVTLAGYMANAKDRPFREIYVDRDIGAWGTRRCSAGSRWSARATESLIPRLTRTRRTTRPRSLRAGRAHGPRGICPAARRGTTAGRVSPSGN